ncbi:hypothetical protein Tco_1295795 [Tanacetum coccineum]
MTTGFLSKLITKNCHLLTTRTVDDAPGLKAFKVPNQNLLITRRTMDDEVAPGLLTFKVPGKPAAKKAARPAILIRNFEGLEARCIIHYPGCEQMAILAAYYARVVVKMEDAPPECAGKSCCPLELLTRTTIMQSSIQVSYLIQLLRPETAILMAGICFCSSESEVCTKC